MITFGVYSMTSKPDYEAAFMVEQSSLQAKIQSAEVFPKTAFVTSSLRIKLVGATKEEYKYLQCKWMRNDREIPKNSGPTLRAGNFSKGDLVYCEVNLLGTDKLPESVNTEKIKILNTPPQIITATSSLRTSPSDVIFVRVNALDADGDKLKYKYKWFINAGEVPKENATTFGVEKCRQGDEVWAEIVASDGTDESAPYKCDKIIIGSNAPTITSQPPSTLTEDGHFVYQVAASALTPYDLSYELIQSPSSMSIDANGRIDWEVPRERNKNYDITVRVSDPTGGEATQSFSFGIGAGDEDS